MRVEKLRARLESLLAEAGVRLDGPQPWDVRVRDERLYDRVFAQGSLGIGEAYVDGWWDCPRLDELFHRLFAAGLQQRFRGLSLALQTLQSRLVNQQRLSRAREVADRHYDLGNELYRCMLDRRMIYSCAYWENAADLDEAQERKLDLVCRKLGLTAGMRVLDIGCGWGGAARFAAERYGVEVIGITVSEQQAVLARQRCAGLPIEIRVADYREIDGRYDRVFSLGMFEHVGYRNYSRFMRKVRELLATDGLFLLHTIGASASVTMTDPWIARYIFPNSMLPSARQIMAATEGVFVMEDWQNFGFDYDRTLLCWHDNVERAWDTLCARYDERFRRMWAYYLLSSAGTFRARRNQLWQIVFAPRGVSGGYRFRRAGS
ncbi:MAG: cyclopropane fatty acyl phospholipid synthase [Gammaproteobacteria bacterium]|nr:cyclopropane fatty acyl phospholipid synthase [Gammaproteobacteria bacterium]